MNESDLRKYGVAKLSKSPAGREYLERLRKKYEKDLVQHGDPRFKKLYGKKQEFDKKYAQKNETIGKDMWAENMAKKEWAKRRETGEGPRTL